MRYLYLINNTFPYSTGESFLESEMPIISRYFDKIIIFPISILGNEEYKKTRNIPSNVESIPIDINNKFITKLYCSISSISSLMLGKGVKRYIEASSYRFSQIRFEELSRRHSFDYLSNDDQIVIYSYWFYTHTLIAIFLKDFLKEKGIDNVKIISRAHGFDVYKERQCLKFFPNREYMLRRINQVFVCSKQGRDYIVNEYPLYQDKIKVGRLGTIDNGKGSSSDNGAFVVVSCSSVIPLKQVHLISQAISTIIKCGLEIEWHHFGDGSELKRVQHIVKEYVGQNVFFHGNVQNSEIFNFYKHHKVDVFVNSSTTEGIPVSIMEAMSFGIPIIAPNVGGISEIISEDIGCVLMSEYIGFEDIIYGIRKIMNLGTEEKLLTRRKIRQYWENNYQASVNYEKFIEQVLNVN